MAESTKKDELSTNQKWAICLLGLVGLSNSIWAYACFRNPFIILPIIIFGIVTFVGTITTIADLK